MSHAASFANLSLIDVGLITFVIVMAAITYHLRWGRAKTLRVFCGTAIAIALAMHLITGH